MSEPEEDDGTDPPGTASLGSRLGEWTGLRQEEVLPVGLVASYGFFAMTSYYILKPVRNSVFLDRVGADALPLIYILVAVVITAAAALYSRFADRLSRTQLIQGTIAGLAAGLLLFRWLLTYDSVLVSGAFFIWGKFYPLLLVSQFWLTANFLFTPRQGRRLFGFVGLGLVVGGIAGAGVSGFAAQTVGTENLVIASALPLLGCSLLVRALEGHIAEDRTGPSPSAGLIDDIPRGALQVFRDSEHLRNIAAVLTVTILVGTLIDWQFNRAIELFVVGEDSKTAFFGRFFATVNLASVVVQLLLTGLVLRRFGVGIAVLILPVGVALGSTALFVLPVLLGVTLLKGAEGTLRYSLDQTSREFLFLPIPDELKIRAKPVIDLAVYRGGTGVGGLLLLVLVNLLGASLRQMTLVTLALVAVWIVLALRTRVSFRASLRALIGGRDREIREMVADRLDDQNLRDLEATAAREEDEAALSVLGLLGHSDPAEITRISTRPRRPLEAALEHPDEEVRGAARRLAEHLGASAGTGTLVRTLGDERLAHDAEIVLRRAETGPPDNLIDALGDPDLPPSIRVRIPTLLYERATPETVKALVRLLPSLSPHLRYRCLKTLNRLRRNRGDALFKAVRDPAPVQLELDEAWVWTQSALEHEVEQRGELLGRTLEQRRWEATERAFRALGLEHPVADLHAAFRGLTSRHPDTRENGLELFEATVGGRLGRRFRPLLDPTLSDDRRLEAARERTSIGRRSREQLLLDLADEGDPLVAVLSDRERGATPNAGRLRALRSHVEARSFRPDPPPPLTSASIIMDILERADFLSRTDLFGELGTEDLVVLAAVSEERKLAPGDALFRTGDVPTELYAVVEGSIEALRSGELLFRVDQREALGKLGLLDGEPSVYDAVAVGETTVLAVSHEDFLELLEDRFEVVEAVLRYLARSFRELGIRPLPHPGDESGPELDPQSHR